MKGGEKMTDGKIQIINGVEYKLVTLRNRSKLVSRDGDLINPYRKQDVKLHLNPDGYPCAGGGVPVHLYVAHAWVDGYFEGAEVNHKDFDRTNYKSDNLEWVTHQENIKYSVENNSIVWNNSKSGENNGRSRFTEDEVREIRKMHEDGMSVFDIIRQTTDLTEYEDLKKASSTYYYLVKNKSWKHVS